jgi:hypothetical protein
MNRYGQLAHEHNQMHRPDAYSQIQDPDEFFTAAGEQIAIAICDLRDEILGPPLPNEDLDQYRLRGYQALATAEEMILADHHLLQPELIIDELDLDPELQSRYQVLSEINRAIHQPL